MNKEELSNKTEDLLVQYKDIVKAKASLYFMLGADKEDIIQEGMIGLYKATQTYDESKGASFRTFAEMCISRQIITAISAANRKKHSPLNTATSLDKKLGDDEDSMTLGESLIAGSGTDPETLALLNEMLDLLLSPNASLLSAMEKKVLEALIDGKKYTEIAQDMGKSPKQIDNTIQRIRGKIKSIL